jgi:hypothetical protein
MITKFDEDVEKMLMIPKVFTKFDEDVEKMSRRCREDVEKMLSIIERVQTC